MKILQRIATVLLAIILFYLIFCFLGPKDMNTEKSASIKTSPDVAYEMVSNLKNWEQWSPWYQKDPEMKLTYDGPASGKGAKYSWEGEISGSGKMEIIEANGTSMKTKLMFDGFDEASYGSWNFTPDGEGTKITWGMQGGDLPFMARGMMFLMGAKKQLNTDFTEGLSNLKKVLES